MAMTLLRDTDVCRPAPKSGEEGGPERPSKEGEHYSIIRKIGEGSFGVIYLGKSDLCPSDYVAIKFVLNSQNESRKSVAPQLRDEYRTYKNINARLMEMKREGVANKQPELLQGIPRVYYYGQETLFNYLIIDYLGDSLEDKFDRCGRRFSVKTTAFLAIQMITRVQTIHKNSYIYRDIKPDNFLLGRKERGEERLLYVVDFGMAKPFENPATKQHIPYREKKSLSGTARYMSINTHLGREQSRRDDMEALGNVFLYFLRGSLPWQGLKARDNREKYERIGQKKQAIRIDELCAGFPPEFAKYVAYTRRLGFEEEPDYEQCREWFRAVYTSQPVDELLDWERVETEGEEKRPTGGASQYESPQSYPNHLPMTGMRGDVRGRVDVGAGNPHQQNYQCQPHSSHQYSSTAPQYHRTTNTSPIFGQQQQPPFNGKKSFWRRIFCLSQRG